MEATLYLRLNGAADRMIRTVVPGEVALTLDEGGTYTIFHEYHSLVDGRLYAVDGVSGLIVTMRSRPGGAVLALKSAVGVSYDFGDRAGRSLFEFEVRSPGNYQLTSSYSDGRREPQTVLAVARDYVQERATTMFIAEILAFGSIALAGVIAMTVFAKRRTAQRLTPPI
jgi:hypothetical protein